MSHGVDVRVIQEHDGRWAARSNAYPTCVRYGSTEAEARAKFDRAISVLKEDDYDFADQVLACVRGAGSGPRRGTGAGPLRPQHFVEVAGPGAG
jgi:predicted RNase H-like HicB family nuclease